LKKDCSNFFKDGIQKILTLAEFEELLKGAKDEQKLCLLLLAS
jgi:hypothetical protein